LEFNKLLADEKLRKKDIKTKQKIRTQMTFLFFLPKSGFAFWSNPDFFYIKKTRLITFTNPM